MPIEMPLWMDPKPGEEQGPATSARQDRAIIGALFTEGVADVGAGDLRVTQRASGAAMSVDVAAGAGYVAGDDVARQGTFRCVVTSTESVDIAGAPASGARIDLIVLRVYDPAAIGGTKQGAFLEVVAGDAAPSPAAKTAPPSSIVLARVRVAAGQASITAGDITDERRQSGAQTLRGGSAAASGTTTQRDAEVNIEVGQLWLNATTGRLEIYGPSGWRPAEGYTSTQVFTGSGTWTRPPRLRAVLVTAIGGGQSGSITNPGVGGAHGERWIDAGALPASVSVTVAAESGQSSFGVFLRTQDASGLTPQRSGGAGGSGGINPLGQPSGPGMEGSPGSLGAAGGSGGSGGAYPPGTAPLPTAGQPGTSASGTRGTGGGGGGGGGRVNGGSGAGPAGGDGGPGGAPGGGGGSSGGSTSTATATAGAGARGEVIVDMYF